METGNRKTVSCFFVKCLDFFVKDMYNHKKSMKKIMEWRKTSNNQGVNINMIKSYKNAEKMKNNASSSQEALTGFHKAVLLQNIKKYMILAIVCFAMLSLNVFATRIINKNGDHTTASSKSVVKFAKVENEQKEADSGSANIGMLAGSSEEEAVHMKTLGDAAGKLEGNTGQIKYDSITLGDNPVWNAGIQKGTEEYKNSDMDENQPVSDALENTDTEKSIEYFQAWTSCSANVRSAPDKNENSVISIKQRGEPFTVVGENGDFWKVKWKEDGYAYIHKSCMTTIQP